MGKKYAILCGLNYSSLGKSWELFGCINDMNLIANMLMDAYGYKEENMYIFRDDFDLDNRYPTKKNITNRLKILCNSLEEDDELWVHMSCHGSQFRDYGKNESDGQDEYVVVYDDTKKGLVALIDDEFNTILKNSKCKILMFFDSCNSGTVGDLQYNYLYDYEQSKARDKNVLTRTKENNNMIINKQIYIFGSARDNELAADAYNNVMQLSMGALSMATIYCLRKSHFNVSCLKLYIDICNFMIKYGYEQRPQFTSSTNNPTGFISQTVPIFIENDVVIENIEIISQVDAQFIAEDVVFEEVDPTEEVAVEEVPAEEVPVEEVPAEEVPTEEVAVKVRSVNKISVNVIESNSIPIKKDPVKKRFNMWF